MPIISFTLTSALSQNKEQYKPYPHDYPQIIQDNDYATIRSIESPGPLLYRVAHAVIEFNGTKMVAYARAGQLTAKQSIEDNVIVDSEIYEIDDSWFDVDAFHAGSFLPDTAANKKTSEKSGRRGA